MRWDLYTTSAIVAGAICILGAFGRVLGGTIRDRFWLGVLGVASIVYGIWVGHQQSGYFVFSIVPLLLAGVVVVAAAARLVRAGGAGQSPTLGASPLRSPDVARGPSTAPVAAAAPAATSPIPAAQVPAVQPAAAGRYALAAGLDASPRFAVLSLAGDRQPIAVDALGMTWSTPYDRPVVDGLVVEELWAASTRIEIALGADGRPGPAGYGATWVVVAEGSGLVGFGANGLVGVVGEGGSLAGPLGTPPEHRAVVWRLAAGRARVSPGGSGTDQVVLSTAEPAGRLSLHAVRLVPAGERPTPLGSNEVGERLVRVALPAT